MISGNGRYIAFTSVASNLVDGAGTTQGRRHVYIRDGLTGDTELVSIAVDGSEGNDHSPGENIHPGISHDGRYVIFSSLATNLIEDDIDVVRTGNIFVRDRETETTELVNVNTISEDYVFWGDSPSISADGNQIAFKGGLVGTGPKPIGDHQIFVRNRAADTIIVASAASNGEHGNHVHSNPAISANGQYVTFASNSDNLWPNSQCTTDCDFQVYRRDLENNTTDLISATPSGEFGNGGTLHSSISDDGRFVAFSSTSTDLVDEDENGDFLDIFLRDNETMTTELVSVTTDGKQVNCQSPEPFCVGRRTIRCFSILWPSRGAFRLLSYLGTGSIHR